MTESWLPGTGDSFADTSEAGDALLCCRLVSVVFGGTRPDFALLQANSGVAAVTQVVQQSERRRGLTGLMIVVGFKPEAVGDGTVNGGALVGPRAVRAAVVHSEGGGVEMEGSVNLDV